MHWTFYIAGAAALLFAVLLFTGWWRYVFTAGLILRVVPYEQAGTGAGTIFIIGDSTGYGTGSAKSSDSVAGRLGADYPQYTITNNSVNGRKIAGAQEVVTGISQTYDLVVLQIGANDLLAGTAVQTVVADMEALIKALQPHAREIVVISSGNIGGVSRFTGEQATQFENISRDYTASMLELAEQYEHVAFVPLFDEPSDDVFVADPARYTAKDGLHPTSDGYAVWYDKAKPYFEAALSIE